MNILPKLCWMPLVAGLILPACLPAAQNVWLSELDLSRMRQGWGRPQVNLSVSQKPLSIAGQRFEHGVGTHAVSTLAIEVKGATAFHAVVGVDDATTGPATVVFRVIADGRRVFDSGVMKRGDAPKPVKVDLVGAKLLKLVVDATDDGTSYDHANWAEACFEVKGAPPQSCFVPQEPIYILTPKPGPAPHLNTPAVYGCRPGHPFIYRIPTTGQRPMKFTIKGLPRTLKLDPLNGILTGVAPARGEYLLAIKARNDKGSDSKSLKIVSGDTLALTPTMGWNHWYAHYNRVTDAMMREAADIMVRTGMADVGYSYVSIDDCWMNIPPGGKDWTGQASTRVGPERDAQGNILANAYFPDMKGLTDYIHQYGLKAGIYSSPGPLTCAGYTASYQHEAQDARQFADWGFDLLKYDWCSYKRVAPKKPNLDEMKKPYSLMGALLQQQDRDIVLNLCQYGMGNVWEWGAEVGGHSWRTAGDLGFELDRIFQVALKNCSYRDWQKPGAWNDPDYIQIGYIGNARGGGLPEPCPYTPSEQYAFMSLWCLMASPLFFSGDMAKLDDFTLNILCNREVIEVNQDPLGLCARVAPKTTELFVMVKDMADGSKAVGLCNGGETEAQVAASWADLGVQGKQRVRDLWRQKDIGVFNDAFQALVPRHGVVMIRLWPKK